MLDTKTISDTFLVKYVKKITNLKGLVSTGKISK